MEQRRRFLGKTAIVTGASRGIGAAIARRLALEGANVVLAARSVDALESVRADIEAMGAVALAVATDVADRDQLHKLVDTARDAYGAIDLLVNNAGVLPPATRSERISVDDWERVIRINTTSPWYLANLCHPHMVAAGGGVIINVTSTAAFYPSVGLTPYNASKAALTMVTKGLALEWARDNIRVIAIAPGKVDTELGQPILAYAERARRRLNPLDRVGDPDEVARLVTFVASDDAAFMTGNTVTLDGGEISGSGSDQG